MLLLRWQPRCPSPPPSPRRASSRLPPPPPPVPVGVAAIVGVCYLTLHLLTDPKREPEASQSPPPPLPSPHPPPLATHNQTTSREREHAPPPPPPPPPVHTKPTPVTAANRIRHPWPAVDVKFEPVELPPSRLASTTGGPLPRMIPGSPNLRGLMTPAQLSTHSVGDAFRGGRLGGVGGEGPKSFTLAANKSFTAAPQGVPTAPPGTPSVPTAGPPLLLPQPIASYPSHPAGPDLTGLNKKRSADGLLITHPLSVPTTRPAAAGAPSGVGVSTLPVAAADFNVKRRAVGGERGDRFVVAVCRCVCLY